MDLTTLAFTVGNEDLRWVANEEGWMAAVSCTLDTTLFPDGTWPVPFGYVWRDIPSGIVLGKVTASGLYRPYASGNSDGSQAPVGFLKTSVRMLSSATTGNKVGAALMNYGRVEPTFLPATSGFDSNARTVLKAASFVFTS